MRMSRMKIEHMLFRAAPRHPPLSFEMLCQALELEALLGRRHSFRRRLKKALDEARRQCPD